MKLQTIQVHHFIDISKSGMDTRNMFVLKHLGQYIFLLRGQCGEKIILRLIVLRLGKATALDTKCRHAVFPLHKAVNKCFIQYQLLAHSRSSIPK